MTHSFYWTFFYLSIYSCIFIFLTISIFPGISISFYIYISISILFPSRVSTSVVYIYISISILFPSRVFTSVVYIYISISILFPSRVSTSVVFWLPAEYGILGGILTVKFREILSNYATRNSAKFRGIRTEYGSYRSTKNRRNSVLTEFRGHPVSQFIWNKDDNRRNRCASQIVLKLAC